jgi:hypothetical protein
MRELIPIKVDCYSGYKADEYPKCFYWNNKLFKILEISDRWYQGDRNPEMPISEYFKVKTEAGELYIIKHDIEKDKWFLCLSK